MKVLIVDDEAHVIKAVRLLVPWKELGISEVFQALTPQEAIRILEEEQPEILITDIVMQDLSGIDLMKYISSSPLHIKVIVISGHNNFDYVRSSLQYGGVDYLLKPLDQDQLIQAVKKAIAAWNQEHDLYHTVRVHKDQVVSMTTLCRENLLSQILNEEYPRQAYQKLLQISPEFAEIKDFGFAYCNLEPFITADQTVCIQRFLEYRDFLVEYLEQQKAGFYLPRGNASEIILFFTNTGKDFLDGLKELIEKKQTSLSFPACIGLAFGTFPNNLSATLENAKSAYSTCNMSDFTPILCLEDNSRTREETRQNDDDDRLLLSALLTGNENFTDTSISQWINHRLPGSHFSLSAVMLTVQEENRLFREWVDLFQKRHEGFVHQSSYLILRYPDCADSTMHFSLDLMKQKIRMDILFLYRELKSIRSPESDMIYQVAHYIELNYSQPFSQFTCAQMFFVNKEYLCRKFKQTFHTTMIAYLNHIRIEHAKQMLWDPLIKIRQIALDVGFEDEKYFARQFKKMTGMTPNDYRMMNLRQ